MEQHKWKRLCIITFSTIAIIHAIIPSSEGLLIFFVFDFLLSKGTSRLIKHSQVLLNIQWINLHSATSEERARKATEGRNMFYSFFFVATVHDVE